MRSLLASHLVRRGTARITALVVAVAAAALASTAFAGDAAAKTTWLCNPDSKPNPCFGSLETTVTAPDGSTEVDRSAKNARKPLVDCFYVYPTVSEQPTTNANLNIDPAQIAIAENQAARFSEVCDVYAPMYRQLTLQAINSSEGIDPAASKLAFKDVLKAWREYLREDNDGRGVVLIGHSQGAGMLSELLRSEIEKKKSQRKKVISALLLGGNVTVKKGSDVGGTFKKTPLCRSTTDLFCVVAFSTFGETPPDDPFFGTPTGALVDTRGVDPSKLRVACTNPATLSRKPGDLVTLSRGTPFPGTIGLGLTILYGGPQPSAPTAWLEPRGNYSGKCVRQNGANVLMVTPENGAPALNPSPSPEWGLHLVDGNIALGNLVDLVGGQAVYYNEP